MSDNTKKLFCFGYGYSCERLGQALNQLPSEWKISGTTRDDDRYNQLKEIGVKPHYFDNNRPLCDAAYTLQDATHLLISIPPDKNGDNAFRAHAEEISQLKNLEWIGYLSTTAVYGDRNGRWVDEESEISPSSQRGTRRAMAEEQWLSLYQNYGLPVHIFRLAGIYGPGRSAIDSVRAGIARRIHKRGHAFGRIHVDDIVGTLIKSFLNPQPGQIYNVCDNMPAPSHEVISFTCSLIGKKEPPLIDFEDANLAPITRSFYNDNRRTRNEKIKHELGVELKYPDYKTGLQGCLDHENIDKANGSETINKTKAPSIFTKK